MKNDHLIPIVIKDIVDNINASYSRNIDKEYQVQRLETIRDYCIKHINEYNKNKRKRDYR